MLAGECLGDTKQASGRGRQMEDALLETLENEKPLQPLLLSQKKASKGKRGFSLRSAVAAFGVEIAGQ